MKTKAESKHKSSWGFIKVVEVGSCRVYALNENGKLKKKLCRQRTRDIFEEIRKLQKYNFDHIQFILPSDINNAIDNSQFFINSNESTTNSDSIIHETFIAKPNLDKTSTNLNKPIKKIDLDINEPFLNIKNVFDDDYYGDDDFYNDNSSDYFEFEQNLTNSNFFNHNDLIY